MSTSSRRRGGAFGGNLLSVPSPLPEDDETSSATEDEPSPHEAADASPEPSEVVSEPMTPEPDTEAPAAQPEPAGSAPRESSGEPSRRQGSGAATATAGRDRPPATIRLDDRAAGQLWDAYVEAKAADPFLSYRQFASGVVLDGLATHRRRQQRS